jgi:hypothetical protein
VRLIVVGEHGSRNALFAILCWIAKLRRTSYDRIVKLIRIRFPDQESKRRGLGFLAGRFSFTSYTGGEVLVVESALTALAVEGLSFTVEGRATCAEAVRAFRTPPAHQVR